MTTSFAPTTPVDTLINARWVIPIEPQGKVLEYHSVALAGKHIAAVLPTSEALTKYPQAKRVDRADHAVLPGLVNTHTHAAMVLLRGAGDDMPLMDWLQQRIWPLESGLVSDAFVYEGTALAAQEMLRSGTTTFQDMYFFPDAAARAVLATGMRATLGCPVIEFPTPWASDPASYIEKGLAVRDQFKDESRLSFALAPHAPYTVSNETFKRLITLSQELDIELHIHLHETQHEVTESLAQYGVRPIERLHQLGFFGPNVSAAHCVHLTPQEMDLFATCGVRVAHCPASNLKLASGFAPIADLLERGVTVSIGTDGAASNNRLDMLSEMRLAALVAKASSGQATALNAAQALTAATLGGAQTLGLQERIGSLVVGKEADLICMDLSAAQVQPVYDPLSAIVYAADANCVTDAMVQGQWLVRERAFCHSGLIQLTDQMRGAYGAWHDRAMKLLAQA